MRDTGSRGVSPKANPRPCPTCEPGDMSSRAAVRAYAMQRIVERWAPA